MNKIPISLLFFTSTKSHYGFPDVYLATLNHLDRQVPLYDFSVKVAHIKVSPNQEDVGNTMENELVSRGFKVLKTTADWNRGLSHGNQYLADQIKVSMEQSIYSNSHILFLEDDSTIESKIPISALLSRMTSMLDADKELLTVRLLRPTDLATSPIDKPMGDFFYSPHTNFQPLVMRSIHFHLMLKFIEDNMEKLSNVQCEMVWRIILAQFSRSQFKHAVFYPDFAFTTHLGVPNYLEIKKQYNL